MFDDKGNSENWYIVYVWSTIFDRCMLTIDGSLVSRYVLFEFLYSFVSKNFTVGSRYQSPLRIEKTLVHSTLRNENGSAIFTTGF